ncbi:MAG: SPOR domain-containing protein [Plesiomonas sp.]|uniref:SPOR domain-containing protein n=1 Tax=Plesiomonas sp. TaxID=2486279 RepID=UPI003F30A3D0
MRNHGIYPLLMGLLLAGCASQPPAPTNSAINPPQQEEEQQQSFALDMTPQIETLSGSQDPNTNMGSSAVQPSVAIDHTNNLGHLTQPGPIVAQSDALPMYSNTDENGVTTHVSTEGNSTRIHISPAAGEPEVLPEETSVTEPETHASTPRINSTPDTLATGFIVQVVAISDQTRATNLLTQLKQSHNIGGKIEQAGTFYRVQLGPIASRAQAEALRDQLKRENYPQAFAFANADTH